MANERQLSEVLSEFARTMVTDFPIQGILDHLVERIVAIMPVTAAGVTLISPGVDPRYIAASNEAAMRFEELQSEVGEGPCIEAYHTGEAVAIPDLRREERFPEFSPRAMAGGLAAVFTFPLHHGVQRLGALDLYRDTPGELSDEDMSAAQTLADVAAAYLLIVQARSDLQDSSDRARQAALHDDLTGLPNRTLVVEGLTHHFARDRRPGKTPAVLFIDLDRFKQVNDTFGHRVGDQLLVAVARRLSSVLRSGDTLGRLYGDEFVLLCEDLDLRSRADGIVERITSALSAPFVIAGTEVDVTASIGITFADPNHDAEQLLHDADVAMYQAKRAGGGRVQVLDQRDQHLAELQAGLGRDLRGISGRNELRIDYQPIVATTDRRIMGVEALLRWTHPLRGPVRPTVLVPLAEQSGLITTIGKWVLQEAWAQRSRWQTEHPVQSFPISVNVSADQLMSIGFADTVAAVLQTPPFDPQLLVLEVTETVFVRDIQRARTVLDDLKDLGVTVAIDDFGTGYSSLSYLRQFPVDIIKIDQSFIADLGHDRTSQKIVTAIIDLAHSLEMTVVAEGVETAEQYDNLVRLGCDHCQGFYFARPMPAIGIDALL
jgi:diguanylate cyclase (GGDEF)-like protein